MKKVVRFFMNVFGIILFGIVVLALSQLFDFLSPKLIDLGWSAYFLIVLLEGIVFSLLMLFQIIVFMPFYYLITTGFAKIICSVFVIIGFIYSVITPWQFSNALGFSFIVLIWDITLTFFIFVIYYSLFYFLLISKDKKT